MVRLHDHMHGDWCPSASVVSGTPVEPGKEVAHKSQSIFCFSGSYSKQRPSRMCDHHAHNLLVLRSLQFSFTFGLQSLWGDQSVLVMCVFLTYKWRVGNIISVKTLVRQLPGARPALPALSERNGCVKETVESTIKIIQGSNLKFEKAYGKSEVTQAAPAAQLPTATRVFM